MSFVQVPPDSTGKKIATIENGSGEQVQVVALDSGTEVSLTGAVPLPTNAATETTLAAISALQAQIANLADGIQYLANSIGASMPRLDVANRQVVNIETGAVTVSGSLTTVSNVTTVASVTNLATIGGVNAIYAQQDIPVTIYDNIKVS